VGHRGGSGIRRAGGLSAPGQYVRWRYRNGPFRVLHDRPQEVTPERTLRSLITIGPFRFDETYTLEARADGCRLTATMLVRAPVLLAARCWSARTLDRRPGRR